MYSANVNTDCSVPD